MEFLLIKHLHLYVSHPVYFRNNFAKPYTFLTYGKRVSANLLVPYAVNISAMGYAVPGIIIAVGVLLPFAWLEDLWIHFHVGVLAVAFGFVVVAACIIVDDLSEVLLLRSRTS